MKEAKKREKSACDQWGFIFSDPLFNVSEELERVRPVPDGA